jgi:hypothetical protein
MNQIEQMVVPMEWAKQYGFEEAALLWWIVHWIKRSASNAKNFHDGSTWIYNSRRAWADLFPCWSEKQIRRIISNLIDIGVLKKERYNKNKYDQTSWYALCKEDEFGILPNPENIDSTGPNGPMYRPEQAEVLAQTDRPIPIKNNSKEVQKEINNNSYLPTSQYLLEKIKASGTDAVFNETHLKKWNNDIRLMDEQDHRTQDQIHSKIDAVFADQFWSKVIRSAGTLRKRWNEGKLDRLESPKPKKPQFQGLPDDYYQKQAILPDGSPFNSGNR